MKGGYGGAMHMQQFQQFQQGGMHMQMLAPRNNWQRPKSHTAPQAPHGQPQLQGDPKSMLATTCQRLTKRPITKADIEYSTAQYGAQFQATVKLNCFNGEAYAGALEASTKAAEKSAAQHALADVDPTYKIVPLSASSQQNAPAAGGMQNTPKLGGAAPATGSDPKSSLNQFCQQYTKRPTAKTDIVYTTQKFGAQFQATVQLNCINGVEYAGALCASGKEAEKAAAQQALEAHAADIAQLSALKRKATDGPGGGVAPAMKPGEMATTPAAKKQKMAAAADNVNAKTQFNTLAMKLAKRALTKGETVYDAMQVEGGFQATVALAALPGEYGGVTWAGEVQPTKQAAEQSAAEIALQQLQADPTIAAETAPKHAQGGGGWGKGWSKGGGWSAGPTKPELPRSPVSEKVLNGTLEAWMSYQNYGWIKPDVAVSHEAAKMRDGKVYVNKKGVAEGNVTKLNRGVKVTFKLFADSTGLVAEEVTVV